MEQVNKLLIRREPPVVLHASNRAESQGSGVRESMNRQRLLIVDDEPRNVRLLEGMLYGEPYELIPAHSGAEALDLIGTVIGSLREGFVVALVSSLAAS